MMFWSKFYERESPSNPKVWHRWYVFFPARLIDGNHDSGFVWRRMKGSKWEYQKRETDSDRIAGDW
jgi:hypothetical protein